MGINPPCARERLNFCRNCGLWRLENENISCCSLPSSLKSWLPLAAPQLACSSSLSSSPALHHKLSATATSNDTSTPASSTAPQLLFPALRQWCPTPPAAMPLRPNCLRTPSIFASRSSVWAPNFLPWWISKKYLAFPESASYARRAPVSVICNAQGEQFAENATKSLITKG